MVPAKRPFLLLSTALFATAELEGQVQQPYKRRHQAIVRQFERGEVAAGLERSRALLEDDPDDPETHFVSTLGWTLAGDLEAAEAALERALALGLPEERIAGFFASVLEPLAVRPRVHERFARQRGRVVAGPLLGRWSATGIVIWVRTSGAGEVLAELLDDEDRVLRRTAVVTTREADEWTARLVLEGLDPATTYRYRVVSRGKDGVEHVDRGPFAFRTAPASGRPARFRIAFGGGAGYVPKHERMWNTVRAENPDALLLLGDNVYIDAPRSPWLQRYTYERRQGRPEFRALTATVPVFAIWDDHDFGTDDCLGSPYADRPAWKPLVWRMFRAQWANPDPPLGEDVPGCFFDVVVADVHLVLLDGRFWRTRPETGTPTMLGPRQKAWLLEVLARERATFTLLTSPVPWTFEAKGESLDTWNGFREERAEIFAHLSKLEKPGVVLVSADRHRSDLWRIERPGDYPLHELNSSRLTNEHVHPTMPRAVVSYNAKQSFGTIDVDSTLEDPTLTYRIVTIDGEEVSSHVLRRSALRR